MRVLVQKAVSVDHAQLGMVPLPQKIVKANTLLHPNVDLVAQWYPFPFFDYGFPYKVTTHPKKGCPYHGMVTGLLHCMVLSLVFVLGCRVFLSRGSVNPEIFQGFKP